MRFYGGSGTRGKKLDTLKFGHPENGERGGRGARAPSVFLCALCAFVVTPILLSVFAPLRVEFLSADGADFRRWGMDGGNFEQEATEETEEWRDFGFLRCLRCLLFTLGDLFCAVIYCGNEIPAKL